MSDTAVRVRFAPSPTGPLHVGSARTALLNWLFARSHSGTLLLRIDDTDRERSLPRWEEDIVAGLTRLGLDWDAGPLRQSERGALYAEALARLVENGSVAEREGAFEFAGRVVARGDGSALYHLATAVDEIEDGITHVLRGRDHTSNTELQRALIEALGARPPEYLHAPLLLGDDGTKLSKREGGDVTVAGLLADGIPPLALDNALALSLAEFGGDEVMTDLEAMVVHFDAARLHTADSHFDHDKLLWLSGQHIRAMSAGDFASALAPWVDAPASTPLALEAAQSAASTLTECAAVAAALVTPPQPNDAARELLDSPAAADALSVACTVLAGLPPADIAAARERFDRLKQALRERDIALGVGLRAVRAALSGRTDGPELPYVLALTPAERLRNLCA